MMVVYESTWFCWEVQGLEQGKFLQMRSFRVLAFPCLASLALVERRPWTCGDAFCGSWPHITNRRIASSVPRRGFYLDAELCVGWIWVDLKAGGYWGLDGCAWGPVLWVSVSRRETKTIDPCNGATTVMSGWEMMEKATCYHRIGL